MGNQPEEMNVGIIHPVPVTGACEACGFECALMYHHWYVTVGVDLERVYGRWVCPSCNSMLTRSDFERVGIRCPPVPWHRGSDRNHFLPAWFMQVRHIKRERAKYALGEWSALVGVENRER